jgi:hypothetical protein
MYLIVSTYRWHFINMPYINMPHIDMPRFRLHLSLPHIDMPCIDMPSFRLHLSLPHIDIRVSMAISPSSQYVMAPSRHLFYCHLSFTLTTHDLLLQIRALSSVIFQITLGYSLLDTSLQSLLQGPIFLPVPHSYISVAPRRIQTTSTSCLYRPCHTLDS